MRKPNSNGQVWRSSFRMTLRRRSRPSCRRAKASRSSSSASSPQDTTESKRTVFKTVAAFASGYGGNMVFGIEKDEATVCGLDGIDPLRERDRLAQLVRAIVTPAPEAEVRQYNVDGKVLLVLSVGAGANRPYGITLPGRKDKPVEFYVRRDATTFPATADEVRNAVLASASQPAADPPWGY